MKHALKILIFVLLSSLSVVSCIAEEADTEQKDAAQLFNVTLPVVDFEDVSISQVLKITEQRHKELRPSVSFPPISKELSFKLHKTAKNKKVESFKARDIKLLEFIKKISELYKFDVYQTSDSVLFVPEGVKLPNSILIIRTLRKSRLDAPKD
jgi:hypothetical protein